MTSHAAHDYRPWYNSTFPRLTGGGLWLRGGELNTLPPGQFERRPCRVLIARLSTYRDTGASLAHRIVYQVAAREEDIYPDLAFLPPPDDVAVFEADEIPWLIGTQSKRGAAAFDCIAFSNAIVQELVNLPSMLARSGIPLRLSERIERDDIPLVILGGANAGVAAGLLAGDSMVDGVFAGNDPKAMAKVFATIRDLRARHTPKARIIERLGKLPGFLSMNRTSKTPVRVAGGAEQALGAAPVQYHEDQMGTGHVVVTDGCAYGCGFCFECWMHRPYRERKTPSVVEQARAVRRDVAAEHIELYGYSVNAHRHLGDIMIELASIAPSIGLKSQRLDIVARERSLLTALRAVDKGSLTVGVEGISQRMRAYLDKALSEERLIEGISAILDERMRELKVFLVVTGQESEADFEEFDTVLGQIREARERGGSRTRVIFSATPLVCFPHTPMEFADAPEPSTIKGVLQRIAHYTHRAGFEYRESSGAAEQSLSQALARPVAGVTAEALVGAVTKSGYVYYRDVSDEFASLLYHELSARGVSAEQVRAGFGAASDTARPWCSLDSGVPREVLLRRWERSSAALDSADTPQLELFAHREPSVSEAHATGLTRRLARRRQESRDVVLRVSVGDRARGVPRHMVGLALARALFTVEPRLVEYWDGYRASAWAPEPDMPCWVTGDDIITTAWQAPAIELITRALRSSARLDKALDGWLSDMRLDSTAPDRWSLTCISPFAPSADRYFTQSHISATRRKSGDGTYEYELNKQSLRRDVVRGLSVRMLGEGAGCEVQVTTGSRFSLETFMKTAFELADPRDWMRVSVCARAD